MSFLLRASSRFVAARPAIHTAIPSRTFTASGVKALKESDHSNSETAEHNEWHKQDQLQKQKDGKGHWKPELASNSEEAVAADRQSNGDSIEEMQGKTKDHAEKKHKHGTSQEPGL